MQRFFGTTAVIFALGMQAWAQQTGGQGKTPPPATVTSSSSTGAQVQESVTTGRPARAEAAGAAVTLETSEALFDMAVALNACGYDNGLENSLPVRAEIRAEVEQASSQSVKVAEKREALCRYIREHELVDEGRSVAQYVSLALYLGPPPELTPTADETDMPPDALQVVNVLPLLREFSNAIVLHALWQKHRAEYEAVTDGMHDRVTRMILDTNVYLRLPVSSYENRRFLMLMEPMLSPREPNGRVYAQDYIIVESPDAKGGVGMDQIRHIYLQYMIDPLMYARSSSLDRLQPLLKPVQGAPLEFAYRSDLTLLLTECLIKAVEARTMDVGFARPVKPAAGTRDRQVLATYDAELQSYNRSAEEVRRRRVDLDMRQGWALTAYFYDELVKMEHDQVGLKDNIAEMVYGMDVEKAVSDESQIKFLPAANGPGGDFVKRAPKAPTGMMLAEKKMLEGDVDGARDIAMRALNNPNAPRQDHAEANYVLARVQLMEGEPAVAVATFGQVLRDSENPHTLAWCHIYLGRLYDTATVPNRSKAVAEYKAALAVPGVTPDAKFAAQDGLKQAFALPKTVHTEPEDDGPLDPSGKAEKDAYKPDASR